MAIHTRPFPTPPNMQQQGGAEAPPLRRCTFRRMTVNAAAASRALPMYDVVCTFPDRREAVPLGDIESARPVCAACTYQGIFRADSD